MIKQKHNNQVFSINWRDGNILIQHEEIKNESICYYEYLFMEVDLNKDEAITCIIAHIPKLISEE